MGNKKLIVIIGVLAVMLMPQSVLGATGDQYCFPFFPFCCTDQCDIYSTQCNGDYEYQCDIRIGNDIFGSPHCTDWPDNILDDGAKYCNFGCNVATGGCNPELVESFCDAGDYRCSVCHNPPNIGKECSMACQQDPETKNWLWWVDGENVCEYGCADSGLCYTQDQADENVCNRGDRKCVDGWSQLCDDEDGDGYYEWGSFDNVNKFFCSNGCCSNGLCADSLNRCGGQADECTVFEKTKCIGTHTKVTCNDWDGDDYYEWGGDLHCDFGCEYGVCNNRPTEELCDPYDVGNCITTGDTYCTGNYKVTCVQDANGCTVKSISQEWCEYGCDVESGTCVNYMNSNFAIDIKVEEELSSGISNSTYFRRHGLAVTNDFIYYRVYHGTGNFFKSDTSIVNKTLYGMKMFYNGSIHDDYILKSDKIVWPFTSVSQVWNTSEMGGGLTVDSNFLWWGNGLTDSSEWQYLWAYDLGDSANWLSATQTQDQYNRWIGADLSDQGNMTGIDIDPFNEKFMWISSFKDGNNTMIKYNLDTFPDGGTGQRFNLNATNGEVETFAIDSSGNFFVAPPTNDTSYFGYIYNGSLPHVSPKPANYVDKYSYDGDYIERLNLSHIIGERDITGLDWHNSFLWIITSTEPKVYVVRIEPGACTTTCVEGRNKCINDNIATCTKLDNGCNVNRISTSCPYGCTTENNTAQCKAYGSCDATCTLNSKTCQINNVHTCATDNAGCRYWNETEVCGATEMCIGGACIGRDSCRSGESICQKIEDNWYIQACADTDSDGYFEWETNPSTLCEFGCSDSFNLSSNKTFGECYDVSNNTRGLKTTLTELDIYGKQILGGGYGGDMTGAYIMWILLMGITFVTLTMRTSWEIGMFAVLLELLTGVATGYLPSMLIFPLVVIVVVMVAKWILGGSE